MANKDLVIETKITKAENIEIKALKNHRVIRHHKDGKLLKVYFDGVDSKKTFDPTEIPQIVEKKGKDWVVKHHLEHDFKVV